MDDEVGARSLASANVGGMGWCRQSRRRRRQRRLRRRRPPCDLINDIIADRVSGDGVTPWGMHHPMRKGKPDLRTALHDAFTTEYPIVSKHLFLHGLLQLDELLLLHSLLLRCFVLLRCLPLQFPRVQFSLG